jgi:hypothetical protein
MPWESERERRQAQTGKSASLSAATSAMDDERAAKEMDDFNDAVAFCEGITGDSYPGDLWEYLKDGRTLCKLVNKLKPGIVPKVNKPGMPFKEMENLTMYNNACKSLGVRPGNIFRPPELYEKRSSYPKGIIMNLLALERATEKIRGKGSPTPKKKYAYQQEAKASPSPPAAPAADPAPAAGGGSAYSIPIRATSFSNEAPSSPKGGAASPSRTVAHAPTPAPLGTTDSVEMQRRRGAESSEVAGMPDWVKSSKSAQERADMIAAKAWMEAVTGDPFVNGDLWETTKSGVYLCKLINKIKSGTVRKYNKLSTNLPFKCMENINLYLEGCQKLGMRAGNVFRSPDLYEKRVSYPKAIINNIHALARIAEDLPGYKGPTLEAEIIKGESGKFV